MTRLPRAWTGLALAQWLARGATLTEAEKLEIKNLSVIQRQAQHGKTLIVLGAILRKQKRFDLN